SLRWLGREDRSKRPVERVSRASNCEGNRSACGKEYHSFQPEGQRSLSPLCTPPCGERGSASAAGLGCWDTSQSRSSSKNMPEFARSRLLAGFNETDHSNRAYRRYKDAAI